MRCALVFVSVIVGATIGRPRMTDVHPYKINKIGHITEENLQNDVSDLLFNSFLSFKITSYQAHYFISIILNIFSPFIEKLTRSPS